MPKCIELPGGKRALVEDDVFAEQNGYAWYVDSEQSAAAELFGVDPSTASLIWAGKRRKK